MAPPASLLCSGVHLVHKRFAKPGKREATAHERTQLGVITGSLQITLSWTGDPETSFRVSLAHVWAWGLAGEAAKPQRNAAILPKACLF